MAYDYKSAVNQMFKDFFDKQKDYIYITLVSNKDINVDVESLANLYIVKFDPKYSMKAYTFAPPDELEDVIEDYNDLIIILQSDDDRIRADRFAVELQRLNDQFESLRELLKLSMFFKG